MKESGIDWIGQIPEEWRVRPIKHIVETPVTDGPHETPVLYETGIPFLSAEAVKDGVLDFNFKRGYISLKDHDRFKKKISPKKDDIFIVKSGATTGNVGIVTTDEIFDIWSPLALIRCNKTLAIQKYIYFYLLSTLFKSQVEFNWSFGTQQNIGMGVIERIKVILPPVSEQQKIVEVLDKKTAQLDKAKALLEEQIQKLKDYRDSLIYETVTKGLDKTVPMKDSGIDWIGQVPQGWEISKIRYLVTTRSEKRITDSSIPYIGLENIESQTGKFVETGIQVDKSENIVVEIGDVLFGKLRPYLRKYWRATFPSTASSEFLVFQSSELDMNFLYYAIQSDSFIEEVNTSTYGSKMPRASWEYIKNMKIAFPSSLVEQQKIADFLDKQTFQIDKLIQIKNQQIDNINKQRQTLIYDYVTGKRRV